ncbi:hypothetical protein LD39_06320 [Halobacillus sp. BBL2006]|nr:hypothetical protein LD39_06320 [Halobacillus sp. BBL2006]
MMPSSNQYQVALILSFLGLKSIEKMCRINYVMCVMMNESIRQIPEKPIQCPVADGFFYMYIGK